MNVATFQRFRIAGRDHARRHFGVVAGVALAASAVGQDSRPALAAPDARERSAALAATKPASLWDWQPAPLTEPLVTDRPDFTESVPTVPRGHVQFESGYTFTRDSERGAVSRSHTAPEALLRTGLTDSFELRIGWEVYSWVSERAVGFSRAGRHIWISDWSDAAADMSLGFKKGICEQDGWRPALGAIGAITVPSGNAPASSGDVDPEGKLLWAYDLTDKVSLAGNVNLAVPTEDARRFVQPSASISLGVELTEVVGLYTEYYGFYPAGRGSDCAHTANGGLTWKLTDNLQLDWRAGFGLNEQADDFFTGVGFAIRF